MGPPGYTVTASGELVEPLQTLTPSSILSCGELVEPCKRRGVCPSCGAKRAVKFAEHIYNEVIEDVPHGSTDFGELSRAELAEVRHTVFTIPKRLRVFFKYDRKLNSILFKAAWGALAHTLGIDERELAAIFTIQTAGDALKEPLSGAASWRSQVRGGDISPASSRNTSRWLLEGWHIHKVPRN